MDLLQALHLTNFVHGEAWSDAYDDKRPKEKKHKKKKKKKKKKSKDRHEIAAIL